MMLQKSATAFYIDWVAISFRWVAVTVFLTLLAFTDAITWASALVLLSLVVWNIFLTILAVQNQRLLTHRQLNVAADLLACSLLFALSGGINSPLAWVGVLVWFTSAVYLNWRAALLVAAGLSVLQLGSARLLAPAEANALRFALLTGANLGMGLLFSLILRPLVGRLRQRYFEQITQSQLRRLTASNAEQRQLEAFYQAIKAIETLSATLDYHVVLETTLNLSLSMLRECDVAATKMVAIVLLFRENNIQIEAAIGLPPADLKQTFRGEKGALAEAIEREEPCLIQNPAADAELGRMVAMKHCNVALCLPLRRGLSTFGAIIFAHPDPAFLNPARCELLEMLIHQAVIATQNARLYHDLEAEKQRIVDIQEETRNKLARDLHDGPTQSVAAIALRVNLALKMLEENPDRAVSELQRIEDLAQRTTQEIRHMLFTLRPLVLESKGLVAALQSMAAKMENTFQQKVKLKIDPRVVARLETGKQTVVFYLVEEAVNNARKHAQASEILVRLQHMPKDKSVALLEIADNGVGFDLNQVAGGYDQRDSLGMVNLRERSKLINGILKIQSAPGKGTRVKIYLPLSDGAADRQQRGVAAG